MVNGPLTPALPGRRIALRERELKADRSEPAGDNRLPLPQGDTAAREGWGEGTRRRRPQQPTHRFKYPNGNRVVDLIFSIAKLELMSVIPLICINCLYTASYPAISGTTIRSM